MTKKVIVIGGGVVGVCCALNLLKDGHDVTIVEPNIMGEATAWASCGFIATSEVIPISKPGILLKAPKWFLDPAGPLTIRSSALLSILPWFMKFAGNAKSSRIHEISKNLAALTTTALEDFETLFKTYNLNGLIGDHPIIELYDTEEELKKEQQHTARRRELGFEIDEISGAEAAEMEPCIAKDFAKALILKDWRTIADSKRFVTALVDAFIAAGGNIHIGSVKQLVKNNGAVSSVILEDESTLNADYFVLAAGAWTKQLAKQIDLKLDIEAVTGYQTIFSEPGFEMKHSLVYATGGFGITSYESGVAIGGSIEFSSLNASPNFNRAKILVKKAYRVLPNLTHEAGEERTGHRPLTPDTLPIIDRAHTVNNVLIASGHGQLGVTIGARTGQIIADLVAGRPDSIDLTPYSVKRFNH
ncbi:MAG: FAD-binding oxidoreductase [Cocleimonas sp.]